VLDLDTFLTELYVMVDDFCKSNLPSESHPGPAASLSRSEVVTLAMLGQWHVFGSERGFFRYAQRHLRAAFPSLPDRSQFNRLLRLHQQAIVRVALSLADQTADYQALDTTAAVTRDRRRRGRGWLPGQAEIGYSSREGWFCGFRVLIACTPDGSITGFCFAPGSAKDQPLAEDFFAVRHTPHPGCPSAGTQSHSPYLADKGFAGRERHAHWRTHYGADLICPPLSNHAGAWPPCWRQWLAHFRQIIESVHDKLLHTFRLSQERPHHLTGFAARLAAKVGLHNFCIWLNRRLGCKPLAFAELIAW